jgi:ABC-type multidrug transport system fused ATPase/permease subunit
VTGIFLACSKGTSDFLVSLCSCQANLPRCHSFGFIVGQLANNTECIVYYMQDVEQEAPYEIPSQKPPPSWPAEGRPEFKDILWSYRPGLHSVFNGVSMSLSAGGKIGIAGRAGAGRSSTTIGSVISRRCLGLKLFS